MSSNQFQQTCISTNMQAAKKLAVAAGYNNYVRDIIFPVS
jgi:hypothetical protein